MDAVSFISTLILHFPVRHDSPDKEKAWTLALVRELRGYGSEVLEKACESIIRNRKDRRFPVLAECRAACTDAKRWLEMDRHKGELSTGTVPGNASWQDWTEDAFKFSRDAMSGPMGLQAAKEGWIGCLDAYLRQHRRAPSEGEIPTLKRQAKGFDETYAACVRGGFKDAAKWEEMGAEMLRRRNKLVDWRLSLR
jgi:hypothetical protein